MKDKSSLAPFAVPFAVRTVQSAGQSVALNILYPYPEAASKRRAA